uniref:Jac-1 n=1 Tax=Pristionchus pacificus TaxID=54126 RepID=A0A2A6BYN3_PRIPA|eukprot:PDM70881.1 jac-1 [Pristionchus pacificus]
MAGWLDPPMEVIPEEGENEWMISPLDSSRRISRRREIITSEQLDTLVSTVPKDRVPQNWIIDNEVVEPRMASTYLTEGLGEEGGASARGSTYTYTYESHYDLPPEDLSECEMIEDEEDRQGNKQTHKVTRVTRVTTTRSVRQIPVESPFQEVFFDANGLPIPYTSSLEGNSEGMGIRLCDLEKIAPPPAPISGRNCITHDIPDAPGMPEIVESDDAQITLCWTKPKSGVVLGYQIEMRDYPEGDWERVHDQILREPSCTITNLDSSGQVQLRVSAAGRGGFSPPSPSSIPILLKSRSMPSGSCVPLSPGKPVVVGVDGSRASLEWTAPPANPHAPPILGYQVEYRVYGTTDWIIANDSLTIDTRYQIDNLRPNGVYEFRVRARNEEGLGSCSRCSGPAHIKPAVPLRNGRSTKIGDVGIKPPGQPIVMESDVNWVKLEWGEVKDDVEYIVELREVGDPSWYQANNDPVISNSIHLEGLRPGSTYEFRVFSLKNGQLSAPSEVSEVISLRPLWKSSSISRSVPSRPSPPELMEMEVDRVTLCWQPALSTLPVLGYDIEFRDFQQDAGWYKVNDSPMIACKMTVGDLIIGHDYEFRIIAVNSVGYSDPSLPSIPLTIKENSHSNGDIKMIEMERFGAIGLLQEEMVRESPPLPDRDDSPPPINRSHNNGILQWRDPNLREVIEYLSSMDKEKQKNASGYLQHLTYSDQSVKDETRELGGIPKLLLLLRSDNPLIVKNACGCLKNLCYGKDNDTNKMEILSENGVGMLAAVVSTGANDDRAKEATGVLWNLSSNDKLKKPILEYAAQPLAHIICSRVNGHDHSDAIKYYQTSLFKNATGVLRNISAADSSARRILRSIPFLIDTLIHLLTLSIQRNYVDSTSVENAVCILRNLSYRIEEVQDANYDPIKTPLESSKRAKSAQSSPKPSKKDKKKEKKKEEGGTNPIVQASQVFKQLQSIIIIFYRGKIGLVELVSDLSLSHKNK